MSSATNYVQYGISAGEGFVICFANGLLLLSIILDKTMRKRKEMIIISGLCCADMVFGLGALTLNLYRIVVMVAGLESTPFTAWDCLLLPQVALGKVGEIPTATMNLIVSLDRYIAIAYPAKYLALDTQYATKMLIAALFPFLAFVIVMFVSAYFYAPIYSSYTVLCVGAIYPRWFTLYSSSYVTGVGILTVIVYIFIFTVYRKHLKQMGARNSNLSRQAENQRRLTVTLGFIALSTTIFFIIPVAIYTYFSWNNVASPYTVPLAIISKVSTIANIVIYVSRQREVRPGMWNILRCKKPVNTIPANITRNRLLESNNQTEAIAIEIF